MRSGILFQILIIFALFSVLPILVIGLLVINQANDISSISVNSLNVLGQRAVSSTEKALEDLGKTIFEKMAVGTAKECELYLQLHPELLKKSSPKNRRILYEDKGLKEIVLSQRVGKKGTICFYENDGCIWVAQDKKEIGMEFSKLAGKSQQLLQTVQESFKGKNNSSIYDWADADGVTRKKYIYCAVVGNTPFRIATTAYLEDFTTQPIKQMKDLIQDKAALIGTATKNNFDEKKTGLKIFLTLLITAGIGFFVLSTIINMEFIAPNLMIAEIMERIGNGDLKVKIPDELKERDDQLGSIAKSLDQIISLNKISSNNK